MNQSGFFGESNAPKLLSGVFNAGCSWVLHRNRRLAGSFIRTARLTGNSALDGGNPNAPNAPHIFNISALAGMLL